MNSASHKIDTLSELAAVAGVFSTETQAGDVIYLVGDLGAGKTTFAQNYLQACGVITAVKSPTYTLYENYQAGGRAFVHMDLYRLTDPEELYFLGIEELVNGQNELLVEWPQKGHGVIPKANWTLNFTLSQYGRTLTITSN